MKIVESLVPGSSEWISSRSASKAPAMMGDSDLMTRNELLHMMHTGVGKEFSDWQQKMLLDKGLISEVGARDMAEDILNDGLSPVCFATDDGYLTAAPDGTTFSGKVGFEAKAWNEKTAAAVRDNIVPDKHAWQLDQQIYVGELDFVLFMVTDGTPEKCVWIEYRTTPERISRLLAGWKQFDADLAAYVPPEVIPEVVAAPTMDLPVVSIQTSGAIAIRSNLRAFGEALNSFIERLPTKPSTDQEFADCKAALAKLKTAEETLESEESRALAQMSEVDEMRREKKLYQELARTTRLALEKMVVAREAEIKREIVQSGKDRLAAYVATFDLRFRTLITPVSVDFSGAIKNKRTLESLRNAVDTELARAKIKADETAAKIASNIAILDLHKEHQFLFADIASLALKAPDDLAAIIKNRISEHKAAEDKRLEAERERIRKEEQTKAEVAVEERGRLAGDTYGAMKPPTANELVKEAAVGASMRLALPTGRISGVGATINITELYNELLSAVQRVFPGETRHQTALRYIRQAELTENGSAAMSAKL